MSLPRLTKAQEPSGDGGRASRDGPSGSPQRRTQVAGGDLSRASRGEPVAAGRRLRYSQHPVRWGSPRGGHNSPPEQVVKDLPAPLRFQRPDAAVGGLPHRVGGVVEADQRPAQSCLPDGGGLNFPKKKLLHSQETPPEAPTAPFRAHPQLGVCRVAAREDRRSTWPRAAGMGILEGTKKSPRSAQGGTSSAPPWAAAACCWRLPPPNVLAWLAHHQL